MAPYKIIKQGYMWKEPPSSKRGLRKKLRRYWFVLLEDKKQVAFVYYKNENVYIARQRNVGFIRIDNSRVNVIGEYLTYKNAFSIVTEKSKYMFVPETRYELHDWIFTLHNTLEGFHRRMDRVRVRMEHRQRAMSASSGGSVHTLNTPTTLHPPQTTPTNSPLTRTPPIQTPLNASPRSVGSGGSRRPRRPAPVAPGRRQTMPSRLIESGHTPTHTHDLPHQYSNEGPALITTSQTSTCLYGDMESEQQHPVLDLDITQTEEPQREDAEGEGEGERGGEDRGYTQAVWREEGRYMQEVRREEGGYMQEVWGEEGGYMQEVRREEGGYMQEVRGEEGGYKQEVRGEGGYMQEVWGEEGGYEVTQQNGGETEPRPPPPVHQRSESDTTVLLSNTNFSSLPELDEHSSSVSPDNTLIADTVEGAKRQISEEMPIRTKHTRHLSLLSGSDGKRKKRRQQSLKNRSRSPPNYPPPPPPADEDSGNEASGDIENHELTTENGATRKNSLGFSKVMKTISSIDQELEEMRVGVSDITPNISPPMRFRDSDPQQSPTQDGSGGGGGDGDVVPPLHTVREEEGDEDLERDLIEKNLSPSQFPDKEVTTRIFFSETANEGTDSLEEPLSPTLPSTKRTPPPVPRKPKPKPKPKKNKVMFKEEVEDIPSYEPRIDDEAAAPQGDEENIPASVAGLKKMLFGQTETQKYSKEGPMSLRLGAIVDIDGYDEDLHALLSPKQRQSSFSPDVPVPSESSSNHYQHLSNFTSTVQSERVYSPPEDGVGPAPQKVLDGAPENEYDAPWDSKPISKYSVVSHRKQTVSPAQRAEQFEVVTHTTAVPGDMERRNVNSLERQLRKSPDTSAPLSLQQAHTSPTPVVQDAKSGSPGRELPQMLHFSHSQTHDSDLLQSISSTLQSRSKYGSDSLLSMGQSFSQGDVPMNYEQHGQGIQWPIRRSAHTNLEQIHTQHKRGEGNKLVGHAYPAHHNDSQLKPKKTLSSSQQSVNQGVGRGAGGRTRGGFSKHKNARKAQSMDGLHGDPSTLVTYDTYTHSHTYQSLV